MYTKTFSFQHIVINKQTLMKVMNFYINYGNINDLLVVVVVVVVVVVIVVVVVVVIVEVVVVVVVQNI